MMWTPNRHRHIVVIAQARHLLTPGFLGEGGVAGVACDPKTRQATKARSVQGQPVIPPAPTWATVAAVVRRDRERGLSKSPANPFGEAVIAGVSTHQCVDSDAKKDTL